MAEFPMALAFEAFGARIGVRAPGRIASRVRPRLPPTAKPIPPERLDAVYRITPARSGDRPAKAVYTLTCTGVGPADPTVAGDFGHICHELESDLHFRVAVAARGWLFVHAGVVAWEGAAIVFPGRTLVGKSSLVLALLDAGATYFSDEYAVFDEEGRVHPYLKPLSLRREGQAPALHPPESLSGPSARHAVPLGRTVVTRFREGAAWNPVPITPADAMMALFANTVAARTNPELALACLARAVMDAQGLEGDRGEAAEVAGALLKR